MPQTGNDGGTEEHNLPNWVENLTDLLEKWSNRPNDEGLIRKINDILQKHDNRGARIAERWGYGAKGGSDTGNSPETQGSGNTNNNSGGNGGGGGNNNGSGNNKNGGGGNKGGGSGGGGGGSNRLAGKKGKDYTVVKRDGKTYILYRKGISGNKSVFGLFLVPDKLKDHYGIGKDEGKELSGGQWNKLKKWRFGKITDLQMRGRNGIDAWMEDMLGQFGFAKGFTGNQAVMEVLFEAALEGKDSAWILGSLRQTDWYDKRTEARLKWVMETSTAQRKQSVESTYQMFRDYAMQRFGTSVDYAKFLDDKQMRQWAEKVASGSIKWDETKVQMMIDQKARKTEGTVAWAEAYNEEKAVNEIGNSVEDRRAQIKDDISSWLGPWAQRKETADGQFADNILDRWAKDLAAGAKSDADWQDQLKRWKNSFYGYLDEDEKWTDRALIYKNRAEQLLGTTVNLDDKLLSDLTAKKNDGTRDPATAMSLYDFDAFVRQNDSRFWEGPVAEEEGYGLVNFLNSVFNGSTGGGVQ